MKHILSFDEFTNESYLKGSRQPLYHNTKADRFVAILTSDMLNVRKPSEGFSDEETISFTRSYQYSEAGKIKFVFDSDKLKNNGYNILPIDEVGLYGIKNKSDKITAKWNYNFRPPRHNVDSITKMSKKKLEIEYEERCYEPIIELGKYLISIDLPNIELLQLNIKSITNYLAIYPHILINIYDIITYKIIDIYNYEDLIHGI